MATIHRLLLLSSANTTETDKWFLVTVVLASILLAYAIFTAFWIPFARSRFKRFIEATINDEVCLRSFTYRELHQATAGFTLKLGEGGFGPVYRGTLSGDHVEIAVKAVSNLSEVREGEFQTEMNILGRTHHKNLVPLLGYCKRRSRLFLVYKFMSNGSLADVLFRKERRLRWGERVRISIAVARGLRYLHEECETQIIHCDVKPSNILLNDSWVPKLSDFGLSRLLKHDDESPTSEPPIRGTFGYIAPEFFRNVPITTKVDVFSFGVTLLEIICCRKLIEANNENENEINLMDWVYECLVNRSTVEKLVGPGEVESVMEKRRLERMVMVALWCVQHDPTLRPSMKMVILMLEGIVDVLIPPSSSSSSPERVGPEDNDGELVASSSTSWSPALSLNEYDGNFNNVVGQSECIASSSSKLY